MAMKDIQELIPITEQSIGGRDSIPTVDGRNIWRWLQIHKDYTTWVKHQIDSLQLIENRHYIVFTQKGENPLGGRPAIEYHFTLDAAKHIVMVSRTKQGGEARDYFIEVEKRYVQGDAVADLTSGDALVRMAMAYRDQERRIRALEDQERERQRLLLETQQGMLQAQQGMIELQHGVIEAKENALTAIQSMQWVTIRQYVEIYRMQRQMPPATQKSYAIWLTTYCLERNSAMYQAATADRLWPNEKTYCIAVINETLPGWLKRHAAKAQPDLEGTS